MSEAVRCRCRNLADEYMPPSARIGDTQARRLGLMRTVDCPLHANQPGSPR